MASDSAFSQQMQESMLAAGHEVRLASIPDEFFPYCEDQLPDLVLLDLDLDSTAGLPMLDSIHKRWPKLCVIAVTGRPSMETMREAFKRDVFDCLTKPVTKAELGEVLNQAALAHELGVSPPEQLRNRLGREIRLARTAQGWTLKELSEQSGVSISQLSSIERGAHLPSLESLLFISQAIGVLPSKWLQAAGF